MWFNNVLVYEYEIADEINWQVALGEETLKPCPPHARFSFGWLPPLGAEDELVQEVAGAFMLCLGKEERLLPRSVIEKFLKERIFALEESQGRKIGRTEKAQLAEDLEFELLPKSFCIQKRLYAILDTKSKKIFVNTSSNTQANQMISLLRKSIPSLQVDPWFPNENLAVRFAEWISKPEALAKPFQLASDCLLFSLDNDKKRFNCKGYELPSEEVLNLIGQGLVAAELSLIWNERIQLTLTQDLTIKRIKGLDYLLDERNDISKLEEEQLQRDAELALLSGELRGLTADLWKALGVDGEKEAASSLSPTLSQSNIEALV